MVWIKYLCILSLSFFFICIKGNAIPFETPLNGLGLNLNNETDGDNVLLDMYLMEDLLNKMSIYLDGDSSHLKSRHQNNHLTSVNDFARHVICGDQSWKQRLYRAFKSKFCHIRGHFIFELVQNHCAEIALCNDNDKDDLTAGKGTECGKILYNWVSELFDINEDTFVDHHERYSYESETDGGCANCKL